MLRLESADVHYGTAQALHGVSLELVRGEATALIGRNGAGKSTTMKTLAGWMQCSAGRLLLGDIDMTQSGPEAVNRAGVALVPEDRQVFPTLSLEENLAVSEISHSSGLWTKDRVFDLFPRLGERRKAYGSALSGGEQQMLSIGRALMCQPKVLLLDEPTEGLAPVVVSALIGAIRNILDSGVVVALVEQNARVPRQIASRFYVLDSGKVAWRGDREGLDRDAERIGRLLSV